MSLRSIQSKKCALDLITEHYLLQGYVEPVGLLMTYLDSPDRANFQVYDVTLTGLGTDSTLNTIKLKELYIARREVSAIRVDEEDTQGAIQHLRVEEQVRLFIPRFVIQGTLTRGEDTRLGDIFEIMRGTWVAMSNAQIFPITTIQAKIFQDAPLLLVNRNRIRFYEPKSA